MSWSILFLLLGVFVFLPILFFILFGLYQNQKERERRSEFGDGRDLESRTSEGFWSRYRLSVKTWGVAFFIVLLLGIMYPNETGKLLGDSRFVFAFLVSLIILSITSTEKDSETFLTIAKWFAVGIISFIIFSGFVAPRFDSGGGDDSHVANGAYRANGTPQAERTLPPPTQTQEVVDGVLVWIDGTNEANKQGHDTGIFVGSTECVEVLYEDGTLEGEPVYGGWGFVYTKPGDVRYREPYFANHALFIVLRTVDGREDARHFDYGHTTERVCNDVLGANAEVFLFYNTDGHGLMPGEARDLLRVKIRKGENAASDSLPQGFSYPDVTNRDLIRCIEKYPGASFMDLTKLCSLSNSE